MKISSDFLIVGAGIVGLAVARELLTRFPKSSISVLEKENDIGKHASGRNSGVMHSGVYYGSTTLKAKVCSLGAARMRDFAVEHKIACQRVGKVIIATSADELQTLERLLVNAQHNGVSAERLDEKGIKEIEPAASPYEAGIYCPDTAVIDSNAVIQKLRSLLLQSGVKFYYDSLINQVTPNKKSIVTRNREFTYGFLYNCAGAGADIVAKKFGFASDYTLVPFKGIYYKLKSHRRHLVNGNIYPVPDIDLPFLGVHLTRVISGDVYVGPTAIPALGRENYGILKGIKLAEGFSIGRSLLTMYKENKENFRKLVHEEMKKYYKPSFVIAARKLCNQIQVSDLETCDKVGIRPQLINTKSRTLEMDYIVEKGSDTLHVLNSISPAFTSSLAFNEWIVDQAGH